MKLKNHKTLRKNNIVLKKNINTVQKRTILGGGVPITIIIAYPGAYAIARALSFAIPVSITLGLLMGFHMDNLDGGGFIASQIVDNAEAMPGLTATAGTDDINMGNNDGVGTGTDVVNGGHEASQLADNAETMPGLTAIAGPVVITGLAAAGDLINSQTGGNDSEDGSGESGAPLTRHEQLISNLEQTLYHVDRQRRVNMSLLQDAENVLRHRSNVLNEYTDLIRDEFPEWLDQYRDMINSLGNITNRGASSNNTILSQAQEEGIDPAYVFEDIQNRLDIQSQNLIDFLHLLDPEYQSESDTDDEKIREAVQDHALRYPTTDHDSDS